MSRYYFHLDDGHSHPDHDGTDLPDIGAARVEALRLAASLLSHLGGAFWSGREWTMRVTDEQDLTLFSLMLMANNAPATQSDAPLAKSITNGSGGLV